MKSTRKMPATHILDRWKRDAERDARAFAIMKERDCTFQVAWLAAEDPIERCGTSVLIDTRVR